MIKPLVSIIILNWNGGKVTSQCLRNLRGIDYPNYEVVLVDNGSTDGSEINLDKILPQQVPFRLIKNLTNLGFAPANNQAVKIARGDLMLLLNNDTKVNKDFLSILVERMMREDSIGVIQPKVYLMDQPKYLDNAGSFPTKIGFFEHWGFGQKDGPEFDKERLVFACKGACMLIRKSLIDKIGLFDDDFFSYFEETDFCWRVNLVGSAVLFYPRASIFHKVGYTTRRLDVANINFHYHKNRISALIKNLELSNLPLFLVLHLMVSAGIATVFLLILQPKNGWMIIKAWLWNVVHLPKIFKKRSQVQKLRRVSDQELFKKFLHPINWAKYWQDFRRVEKDLKRRA